MQALPVLTGTSHFPLSSIGALVWTNLDFPRGIGPGRAGPRGKEGGKEGRKGAQNKNPTTSHNGSGKNTFQKLPASKNPTHRKLNHASRFAEGATGAVLETKQNKRRSKNESCVDSRVARYYDIATRML